MEKTKLGLPVALMAVLMCLGGWIGGYVVAFVMAGYILIAEEDKFLKSVAVKTVMLMLAFSIASVVIYFIPNVINIIESFISIFTIYFNIEIIDRVFDFFNSILSVVKTVVFVLFAFASYNKRTIKVPFVDNLFD